MKNYVFGYGSLVNINSLRKYLDKEIDEDFFFEYVTLKEFKRNWHVAMNNNKNIPDYKYYVNKNNQRPDIYVCFLNISKHKKSKVNGILFEVDKEHLEKLDKRERNYNRIDISENFKNDYPNKKIWTYTAKSKARKRFKKGIKENRIAISKKYFDFVLDSFRNLGEYDLVEYIKNTDFENIPIVELSAIKIKN